MGAATKGCITRCTYLAKGSMKRIRQLKTLMRYRVVEVLVVLETVEAAAAAPDLSTGTYVLSNYHVTTPLLKSTLENIITGLLLCIITGPLYQCACATRNGTSTHSHFNLFNTCLVIVISRFLFSKVTEQMELCSYLNAIHIFQQAYVRQRADYHSNR